MRAGLPGMCLSYLSKYLLYFSQVLGSEFGGLLLGGTGPAETFPWARSRKWAAYKLWALTPRGLGDLL